MEQTVTSVGVALLGCGVVGGGVARICREQAGLLADRCGVALDIRHVVVRNPAQQRDLGDLPYTGDATAAIDDPQVQIVVELIGGTDVAAERLRRAIDAGRHVVTANKSLLAERGAELFAAARRRGVCIGFEASCAGGIPVIDALTRGLAANRIDALLGIVNGTCNVILTRMSENGWSYADALAEAQRAGFAEADPALDVSGRDAAQKLAVLAGLAFGRRVVECDVHVEGIDRLDAADIRFAADLGYVVKLLAIGQRQASGAVQLRVHPTLVHRQEMLAQVGGSFNAVSVYGSAVGHTLLFGRGAGRLPTASAVVADLIGIATGATQQSFARLRCWPDLVERAEVVPMERLRSRYYLRLSARDVPGTIARFSEVLGRHGISISAILQREVSGGQFVPIVVTTHEANEGALVAALAEIDRLDAVQAPTVRYRIIDLPAEFAA